LINGVKKFEDAAGVLNGFGWSVFGFYFVKFTSEVVQAKIRPDKTEKRKKKEKANNNIFFMTKTSNPNLHDLMPVAEKRLLLAAIFIRCNLIHCKSSQIKAKVLSPALRQQNLSRKPTQGGT
jgi:hypothetical protein